MSSRQISRRSFNAAFASAVAAAGLPAPVLAAFEASASATPLHQPRTPMNSADDAPGARVLDDVPRVGFYNGKGNPEDHMLPSVIRACMEYFRDDIGLPGFETDRGRWQWRVCAYIHGVTGSGFRFPFGKFGSDSSYVGPDLMAMYEQAFAAVGYGHEALLRGAFAATLNYAGARSEDEAEYRRRIVLSIRDHGRPVIGLGVIGPAEPCLICGYEGDGETLVGWNYFQDDARGDERVRTDEAGRFRKRGWFADTMGIIVIGEKGERPSRARVYHEAMNRGLETLCRGVAADGTPLGIAAYQMWIRRLMAPVPENIATDPLRLAPLHDQHNMNIGELAERRAYGATFLDDAAEALPMTGPVAGRLLDRAHRCFQSVHDLMWRVWQTIGKWNRTDEEKLLRFAEQAFRRELASIVRRAQAWELEAIECIREGLIAMGEDPQDLALVPSLEPVEGLRDLRVDRSFPKGADEITIGARIGRFEAAGDSLADLAAAVRAAAGATAWAINRDPREVADLAAWAAADGWRLRIEEAEASEALQSLPWVRRLTDVVVSILHGLPVVTTWQGKAAVVVGYPHLSVQKLQIRQAGEDPDAPLTIVPYGDPQLGPKWVFLDDRV